MFDFFFFLEVTCDSNGGCHSGGVGLIWWVSELMGSLLFCIGGALTTVLMGLDSVVDGSGGMVVC